MSGARVLLLASTAVFSLPLCGARISDCRLLRHHGRLREANACFTTLAASSDPLEHAKALWGLADYEAANAAFRTAAQRAPKSAETRTEWGELLLERFNPTDAAGLFQEAIGIDPNYAPAYLGLARVTAGGFERKAADYIQQALRHDPKLVAAYELAARLALEDGDADVARDQAAKALSVSGEALDAMAVLASIDWLNDRPQSEWMDRILRINPVYGKAYLTGAHFFTINYRYQDAVEYLRKAIKLDPALWQARSELGINLMRLSVQDEAKQQLALCYANGYRNAETVNALRMLDTLKNYQTFRDGNMIVMLDRKEAPLLRPYFETQMARAMATYERKYGFKPAGPVRLEVYPNHEDFVVRTLGLPGQGGILGVTFAQVVAMDSPSARPPGDFHWASTLWHELNHVYVISAGHNRVPRWFAEGVAVHEEAAVAPGWGDRLTPDIIVAVKNQKLLPVAKLDRGFVHPEFPNQVLVSYYQAGKICDFIAERWGHNALPAMVKAFATRQSTPEVVQSQLHVAPEQFDTQFASWLSAKLHASVTNFDRWQSELKSAHQAAAARDWNGAIRGATAARDAFPDFVEPGNSYELLSQAYLAKGNKAEAAAQLERYRDQGGRSPAVLKQLAGLERELQHPAAARDTLERLNDIYPQDEELHRTLGSLLLAEGQPEPAVREYRALLALKPGDTADAHYRLASALQAAKHPAEARAEVLLALEAAPDYKPAQKLLLELSD